MKKQIRYVLIIAVLGLLGVALFVFRPEAQEIGDEEAPSVSESDLQMYIHVYTAMQDDHDLTIDAAIQPYHIALDDFRQIERKIQSQPHMVDRVRDALLQHVKDHSLFAESVTTPTPVSTPTPGRRPHQKKKKK